MTCGSKSLNTDLSCVKEQLRAILGREQLRFKHIEVKKSKDLTCSNYCLLIYLIYYILFYTSKPVVFKPKVHHLFLLKATVAPERVWLCSFHTIP